MCAVTVYTKPECVQCEWTKRLLDKQGIAFAEIDVTADDSAAQELRERGELKLPVVVTPTDRWSGFRPERIKGIAA